MPEPITFTVSSGEYELSLTYDTWPDFVLMMKRMGPLWNQHDSLQDLVLQAAVEKSRIKRQTLSLKKPA